MNTMDSNNYDNVLKELQLSTILSDEEIQPMTPLYQNDATLTQKVQLTYRTLLHSARMRN